MRFEDAYEGWTEQRLTQIDAARLPGGCPRTFRRTINRYEEDGLGERIETLLQVLERLLEAAYNSGRDKTRALQRASRQMNIVRHLWHLSHELKAVSPRAHAHGGTWNNNPRNLRAANRNRNGPSNRNNNNGFRLVQAPRVPKWPRSRTRLA